VHGAVFDWAVLSETSARLKRPKTAHRRCF
jgi:hypothetical protein